MAIRAVLDSSVLISALITPGGAPGRVLDAAEGGSFTLCLSHEIIAETADALLRNAKLQARYGIDRAAVEKFCHSLAAVAEMVIDLRPICVVPDDPKDDPIIATAVAARADYLVTDDRRHLLPLGSHQGIAIVSVRTFLDLLDRA